MGKLDRLPARAPRSPVTSTVAESTYEGGHGAAREVKSELFLFAVANMVGEDTFYEGATDRDERFRGLVHAVTAEDPDWVARFVPYLRDTMQMRSASIVMAAESAYARLRPQEINLEAAPAQTTVRQLVAAACSRADEPGNFLAYWISRYGRGVPMGVKRGLGDAVNRLYTERAALKYDGGRVNWRMGDVVDMMRPTGTSDAQGDLFKYLLDQRHHKDVRVSLDRLPMIASWQELNRMPVGDRRAFLTSSEAPDAFAAAGMTWEAVAGWIQGDLDASGWEAIIPSMGYMALLRNLRNFDEAGISKETVEAIKTKLRDPDQVARSRQFPFRFLSAYNAVASVRWHEALEEALDLSLANVPTLPGRSLILVDCSGSMYGAVSSHSHLQRWEQAAVFGAALGLRAQEATLVRFGSSSAAVPVPRGGAILPLVKKFAENLGGTYTAQATREHYAGHDRVVVVTDEQYHDGSAGDVVPSHVPVYTWNVAGHRVGANTNGSRHTFGGMTDAAFRTIPLLEAGRDQAWPF